MTSPPERLNAALAGRYAIERELGQGGMATVYLADDLKHDRKVALKLLKPELGAVLGVERFLTEIKTTAKLQHPHILPLLDSGDADGLLFYVMPYVEGESLRARLERERQLPIPEAIRIATEVASALDYAHRHGVIHRDVKPENILLHDGQALVADFGIALAVQSAGGERMTQTGLSLGTPQYMSPEQAMGERAIDARSDVYALGAVTYEMLTGDAPFSGSSVQAIVAKVLNERPTPLHTLRDTVPPGVEHAVLTALAKLAADRYATAKEFADALSSRGTAFAAQPATGPNARARHRDPVVLALAALALAATSVAARQWFIAHRPSPSSVIRFSVNLPEYISRGLPVGSSVAISPDGRTIAYLSGSASGSSQQVFIRSADDLTPRPVQGTEQTQVLFLSPEGKRLGFWSNGSLMKVALDGGTPVPLVSGTFTAFRGASWSSRGVIVAGADGHLVSIPDTGGPITPLGASGPTPVEKHETYPIVLQDGETVLYAGSDVDEIDRRTISAVSLATGKRTRLGISGTYPLGVVSGFLVYTTSTSRIMAVAFDERRLKVDGAPFQVGTATSTSADGAPAAAVSASGTLVYQSGTRTSEIVLADAHGGVRTVLPEPQSYGYPRFSPDGKRIAFSIEGGSRRDVWLHDLDGHTTVKFTDNGKSERPEWTPDGKHVVFRTGVESGGLSEIWWRPTDASTPATILLTSGNYRTMWEAVVTPDGRGLVLQRDDVPRETGADVVYRSISGDTATIEISATKADETQARVSPDGKWVAYVTNASGTNEVAVRRLGGPGGEVVVSSTVGTEPVWSRDGRKLYYRDGKQFIEVAYTASSEFKVVSRTPLFSDQYLLAAAPHANYDVAPDGASFLVLRPKEGRQLVYVHNWSAELRRLALAQAPK